MTLHTDTKYSNASTGADAGRPAPFRRYSLLARTLAGGLLLALTLGGCPPIDPGESEDPNPSQRLFEVRLFYHTAEHPFAVVAQDLNADGVQDLITVNRDDNSVSVLIGKSGGGYALHVDYPAGGQPSALALAEATGDGIPDLITANQSTSDLSILPGAADGTFGTETRVALAAGAAPLALAVADLNGDTFTDLITADYGIGSVSVLLGLGAGAFDAPVRYLVGDLPRSVVVADLNNDAKLDLVTANRDTNNISVLLGMGDGTFAAAQHLSMGTNPRSVAAVDLDGDLWMDLVTTNPGSGDISIRLGMGGGTFSAESRIAFDGGLPTRFTIGDFDGDGDPDLAVLLFSEGAAAVSLGTVAILPGDGAGSFETPRYFAAGLSGFDLIAADVNNDTRLDLVYADTNDSKVSIAFGRGDGGFVAEERCPVGTLPRTVAVSDLNRDGDPDLVVLNQTSRDLSILLGRGDGTFETQTRLPVSDLPRALAIGLLNADANPDLVVTNFTQSRVSVFLGRGDGTFQAERFFPVRASGVPYTSEPRSVVLADFNNDTITDILTGNANTDSVSFLAGQGTGAFSAPVETTVGNFPLDVHTADINFDGILDIVFVSTNDPDNPSDSAQPRLVRRFGAGDGTFDESTNERYETGSGPADMALGDLDGDGDYDAVTANPSQDSVYLLAGRAEGKFTRGESIRTADSPNTVSLYDVNGDGLLDIIATTSTEWVSVLLNRGSLAFQSALNYPFGLDPIGGIMADVNGDGAGDIIAVNRTTNDVSVALGIP